MNFGSLRIVKISLVLMSLTLMGPIAKAYDMITEMHGGADPYQPGEACRESLARAISWCKTSDQTASGCHAHPNPAFCTADACMRAKNYPRGMATNPAEHCVTSIPRSYVEQKTEATTPPAFRRPQPTPAPVARQRPVAARPVPAPPADTQPRLPAPRERPERAAPPQAETTPERAAATNSSPEQWAQESAADLQQCSGQQTQANQCCTRPESCAGDMTSDQQQDLQSLAQAAKNQNDQASLRELCARSEQLNVSGGNVSTGLANACYAKHSQCSASCGEQLTKWQNRLSSCGANCDRPLVSNTVNTLQQKIGQCRSYASLESAIRGKAMASAQNSDMANICRQNLTTDSEAQDQASTSSQGGEATDRSDGDSASGGFPGFAIPSAAGESGGEEVGETSLCDLNPNAPGCYQPTGPNYQSGDTSGGIEGVSAREGLEITPEKFNVGADNNFYSDTSGALAQTASFSPKASGSAVAIPNGGGSFISQGGGGSSTNSSKADELPSMLGSGENPNTDILKGESSPSGYSAPASGGTGFDSASNQYRPMNFDGMGGSMPGRNGARSPSSYVGVDLKNYLPGGNQDPRREVSGLSAFHPDIGPKHIDFFFRVSGRVQTLCKLNRLLDCK